jgi:hypothetical protein
MLHQAVEQFLPAAVAGSTITVVFVFSRASVFRMRTSSFVHARIVLRFVVFAFFAISIPVHQCCQRISRILFFGLKRFLFSPPSQALIIFSDTKHHTLGFRIGHLLGMQASFRNTVKPVFRIVSQIACHLQAAQYFPISQRRRRISDHHRGKRAVITPEVALSTLAGEASTSAASGSPFGGSDMLSCDGF